MKRGFTLAELLVATALGMIVLMMVGYALHNTSNASARATTVINATTKARAVLDMIERDLRAMAPTGAMAWNSTSISFLAAHPDLVKSDGTAMDHELNWVRYELVGTDLKYGINYTAPTGDSAAGPPAVTTNIILKNVEATSGSAFTITVFKRDGVTAQTSPVDGLNFDGTTAPNSRPGYVLVELIFKDDAGDGSDYETSLSRKIRLPGI